MSRSFKSLVSTSLFMSLFFMPTMASAASNNDDDMSRYPSNSDMSTEQEATNQNYDRQNLGSNQGNYSRTQGASSYNRQEADEDQDDQRTYSSGPSTSYNRQRMNEGQGANYGWSGDQRAAPRSQGWSGQTTYSRQGWSDQGTKRQPQPQWGSNQGAMMYSHQGWHDGNARNRPYYGTSYNNAPRYYRGSDYYVSSPTQYGPSGYPAYQSIPPDGYYYNTGYSTGRGDYPYSQEYYDGQGQGMGPHMYFNVR